MKTDKWTAFATISFMAVLLISPALLLLAIVKGHFWTAILLGFVIGVEIQLAIVFYRVIESTLLDIARWLAMQMEKDRRPKNKQLGDQEQQKIKSAEPAEIAEPVQPQMPTKPNGPPSITGLDAWFRYYDEMQAAGRKYTLRDLARDTGYNYGHIRNMKAKYDAEHKM